MNLRAEFEIAWRAGKDHDALLELVHAQGLPPKEAYQVLEQLWLDCGFDDVEQASPMQDNLEYVLEKIWYESPAEK
jgi:hypothetical protein